MQVVAYMRVSSEKQADKGMSLEAQRAKLEAYAQLYGLELVGVEVDAGLSADTLDRPALQRALTTLRSGKAAGLLVVKLDRLTRSVRDLGELLETYFAAGKWSLMSVSEQIDTRTAAGRMVLNILASVSQWERETIGERTAEVLHFKQQQHERVSGHLPYGWQLAADGVHLEPHTMEQAVIRRARQYHAQGFSLRGVGQKLAHDGYRPRQAQTWHAKCVQALLKARVI